MSNYTPGPWYSDGSTIYKDIGDERHIICEANDWGEETVPNAIAIAAVPELIAALRAMLIQLNQGAILPRDACVTQARDIYLKARRA